MTAYLQNTARDVIDRFQGGDVTVVLIGFVVPFLLVFIAYLVLLLGSDPARRSPSAMSGLAPWWRALLSTLLQVEYTIYVAEFADFGDLFESLAAIVALIVFIYLASMVATTRRRSQPGRPDRGQEQRQDVICR